MIFRLGQFIIGKPRNPLAKDARKHIALIAFLAWIGLGADGLSSSCYGPEQAYYALGVHAHLAIYLAIATSLTVFLIASAYNQVIRLFPNGGGGYKVASRLLGPRVGAISGVALLIDYMLTIAISIASGTDAIFSLLPMAYQSYKLIIEVCVLVFLLLINLRGAKESIKILLPIFVGFFISHIFIIALGIGLHGRDLVPLMHSTVQETHSIASTLGWIPLLALFLRAYSLGGGTYTGLEAVSNNVHILAEPRVKTGSWTMLYMAVSLSVVAGGIILLYLLWDAHAVAGQTLNAVVFRNILAESIYGPWGVLILLLFEAGLLFVAANTGFLGGPAVLANMAVDSWVPRRFSLLSSRLVTQNGMLFFGIAALVLLLSTDGKVSFLVVLYSMNVFLTFSLSLIGLTRYWWHNRSRENSWFPHLVLALVGSVVCISILIITLLTKFELGGWITIVITGSGIAFCFVIQRHYRQFTKLKNKLNQELHIPLTTIPTKTPVIDPTKPTAIFLVKEIGAALHSILWVQRMFPNYFSNFVFLSHGEVDIGSFGSDESLKQLKIQTDAALDYLVKYSELHGVAAEAFCTFGTGAVEHIYQLAEQVNKKFTNAIYFASRYVYPSENWFTRLLHSDFCGAVQRRLHTLGVKMLILPLNLSI